VPIRHWKSESTLHAIVWLLVQDPTLEIIFLTHTLEAAQGRSKRLRQLAEAANVGPAKGTNTIAHWQNDQGGGVVVMSASQSKIGYNCHALVVDDPIDEDAASDARIRDEVDKAIAHYTARCMRRGKPGPVFILMSRWHPDDPIGRRLARGGWTYIHHPAIIDEGLPTERAFAPLVWDLPALRDMREELKGADPTERIWFAQLMGDPRPEGADHFREPTRYAVLPTWASRTVMGCDFAFSRSDSADWFAACVLKIFSNHAYLLEMRRERLDPNLIESTLKAMQHKYGRCPIYSYQSGPEIGLTNVLLERGVPISRMHARYNKLVRAERTIRRWNDGNISVPEDALEPWAAGFLHRVQSFRGHENDSDDEVDALVSACDGGWGGGVGSTPKTLGRPRV
jgi:predicted phage terminase large subunit-like protein